MARSRAKKRGRLRLVSSHDPADIFDDLDALRRAQPAPAGPAFQEQRRPRMAETFARIPHDRGLELYRHKITGAAWAVLIELDRLVLKARGKNPVRFWSSRLRSIGLSHRTRTQALRQLETAGVITVERRGRGLSPWVTHLWYRQQG
jgi:hypothetical protein